MSELSYLSYLDIEEKQKGSILHSYEYNATVDKINEIIENLNVSYDLHINLPRFDKVDDIFADDSSGQPIMINDSTGKLYPVTSSAYIIVGPHKSLDDQLAELNAYIAEIATMSYFAGMGISISSENVISVQPEQLVDNSSIVVDYNGKMAINIPAIAQSVAESITFIDDDGNWVGDLKDVKKYIDDAVSHCVIDDISANKVSFDNTSPSLSDILRNIIPAPGSTYVSVQQAIEAVDARITNTYNDVDSRIDDIEYNIEHMDVTAGVTYVTGVEGILVNNKSYYAGKGSIMLSLNLAPDGKVTTTDDDVLTVNEDKFEISYTYVIDGVTYIGKQNLQEFRDSTYAAVEALSPLANTYISNVMLDGEPGVVNNHVVSLSTKLKFDTGGDTDVLSPEFLEANGLES